MNLIIFILATSILFSSIHSLLSEYDKKKITEEWQKSDEETRKVLKEIKMT